MPVVPVLRTEPLMDGATDAVDDERADMGRSSLLVLADGGVIST